MILSRNGKNGGSIPRKTAQKASTCLELRTLVISILHERRLKTPLSAPAVRLRAPAKAAWICREKWARDPDFCTHPFFTLHKLKHHNKSRRRCRAANSRFLENSAAHLLSTALQRPEKPTRLG